VLKLEEMMLARVGGEPLRSEFVRDCFTPSLDAYQHGRFNQNRWSNVLGAGTVLAGLAASAVATAGGAATGEGKIAVAVLGVAASGAGVIIQVLQPGRRAVAYRRAAMELHREGWYFVLGHPPYDEEQEEKNWQRLVARVMEERELAERVHDPPADADGLRPPPPVNDTK
jgi:hypothetical protein